ncbi:zf-HC2 domain-containing protein, partial [Streptomyces zhihengii]|uniref:zf-HC2 domain-containing protein n=1 Tax=Streptomyces zhihengii TaxID=1818004 RepID=UPI0034562937
MTSSTDADRHPDVSEISDLTEGLLPPSRAAELRRHLDDCPLCADVHTSLEEIRGLLGTLPGAGRMPADVAGRIDAALAAEALLSATAPAAAGTLHRGDSVRSPGSGPACASSGP